MTHSLQPTLKETTAQSKMMDFGLNPIIKSLLNSHNLSGIDPLLSNDNPRLLWCSDSENGDICGKARMVSSTEGFSLGFVDVDQQLVLLDNERHRKYFNTFLNKSVTMYVYCKLSPGPVLIAMLT